MIICNIFQILAFVVFCVDAKLNFDDSAAFRQKDIFAMDDHAEQDPRETEAEKFGLNYVGMDGNIACLGQPDDTCSAVDLV